MNALTVAPGSTVSFTTADGGDISCSAPELAAATLPLPSNNAANCNLPRYWRLVGWTKSEPSTRTASAAAAIIGTPTTLVPGTATAWVYNDFTVAAPSRHDTRRRQDEFVDAQIAVTYDYVSQFGGASLHRHEIALGLRVEDVTASLPVGALSLATHDVDGDQGATDIAFQTVIVPIDDGSDSVRLKLTRGHTYRIFFELTVTSYGIGGGRAQAQWSKLVVSLDRSDED